MEEESQSTSSTVRVRYCWGNYSLLPLHKQSIHSRVYHINSTPVVNASTAYTTLAAHAYEAILLHRGVGLGLFRPAIMITRHVTRNDGVPDRKPG